MYEYEMIVRGRRIRYEAFENKWVKGYYVCLRENKHLIITGEATFNGFKENIVSYEIVPETFGRYTGLLDKDGNKIFEGDIIEIHFDTSITKPLVVKYGVYSDIDDYWGNNYTVGFYLDGGKSQQNILSCQIAEMPFNDPSFLLYKRNNRLKVIGNIYDNPELLEGE